MLSTSLVAAGAQHPQVVNNSTVNSCDNVPAEAELLQPVTETVNAAVAPADGPLDGDSQQTAIQDPSCTATATASTPPAALATTAAAAGASPGLMASDELPSNLLGWAHWLPTPALLNAFASSYGSATISSPTHDDTASFQQTSHKPVSAAGSAKGLGSGAVQVPELLLAHLQLLSGSLQEAGQHLMALPVLQLARLLAQVALSGQVSEWQKPYYL
jgi:hypothetical protein